VSVPLILTVLCVAAGAGALLLGARLLRSIEWEVIDDDELHERISAGGRAAGWLRRWTKPRPRMLTYRRDRLGRFRRYRR
jgi:hypothetical protein